jgi:protein-tyrosine phosphatase
MANICRSPALMATLRHLAVEKGIGDRLFVDSCGIGWFHLGEHPDRRTFEAAKKKGILIDHRAQQFQEGFFDAFDYLFAVDADVVEQLKAKARTEEQRKKIFLATAFAKKTQGKPIPDPYYMSPSGFDEVMEIVLDACRGIMDRILLEEK